MQTPLMRERLKLFIPLYFEGNVWCVSTGATFCVKNNVNGSQHRTIRRMSSIKKGKGIDETSKQSHHTLFSYLRSLLDTLDKIYSR